MACALLVRASGSQFLVEPWNPWGAVLPFLCFLLLLAAVAKGDRKLLPWAVLVGSHCIQCHVGYLPLVAAPLGIVVLLRLRADRARGLRPIAWAVGVGALLWLPPVVDQIRREPGNLSILWNHFASPDGPAVGFGAALEAFVGEFNVAGGWLWGPNRLPTDAPNVAGFVAMVAFVGAGAAGGGPPARSHRPHADGRRRRLVPRRHRGHVADLRRVLRLRRAVVVDPHRPRRRGGGVVVRAPAAADGGRRHTDRPLRLAAIGMAAAVSVVAAVQMADDELPAVRNSRLIGVVTAQAAGELDDDGRYLVRWHDPASLGAVGFGAVLELERRGFTAGVDAFRECGALPHRVMPEETATAVLWVVTGEKAIDAFRARADATELGFYDQRTRVEQAAALAMREEMEDRLTELGLADLIPALDTQYGLAPFVIGDAPVPQDFKNLAAAYNELRLPMAMFAVAPGAPPLHPVDGAPLGSGPAGVGGAAAWATGSDAAICTSSGSSQSASRSAVASDQCMPSGRLSSAYVSP